MPYGPCSSSSARTNLRSDSSYGSWQQKRFQASTLNSKDWGTETIRFRLRVADAHPCLSFLKFGDLSAGCLLPARRDCLPHHRLPHMIRLFFWMLAGQGIKSHQCRLRMGQGSSIWDQLRPLCCWMLRLPEVLMVAACALPSRQLGSNLFLSLK